MRASAFVGRVGGLAVALGIGAAALSNAALGTAAQASAAPADTSGSSAASDTATQTDSTASAPRSRAGRSSAASPAQHGARRSADSTPVVAAPAKGSGPVSRGISAPVAAVQSQSIDRSAARVVAAPAVGSNPVVAQTVTATASQALGTAPAAVPVMTPAPAAAVAPATGALGSVLSPLLGTNPGAPVEAPLSWVVLAVARRQESQTPVAPAAAVVTTAAVANVAPAISTVVLSSPNASTGAVTGTVKATDANSDKMTYKAVTSGAKGTVSITTAGVFTYTPTAKARHAAAKVGATTAVTTDTVTVTVTDAKGASTTKAVTVTISPKNAVPVTKQTVRTPNSSTGVVTGSVTATDADKDALTYSGSATTTKGTVSVNATTGAFTYTPTATARHTAAKLTATAADKTDTFTVTVADGYGGTVAVPVTVTVSPKNTAPVSGTTTVGTPNAGTGVVTGTVTATDAENDALAYSALATTTKGSVTVNASTGAFTYTPTDTARGTAGTDSFTVTVVDGYGGSTPVVVSVPITAKTVTTAKVTYVFNYTSGAQYWTPESKAALQASADQIAAYIVVSQPVTLTFDVTAANAPNSDTMASTGSDLTSSRAGFYNTVVQNKILTGVDSNGVTADGYIDVNFGTGYVFGDTVSASQYDFKSTMMHEMLHAYGFLSYTYEPGNNRDTYWTKFDSFIGTKSGAKVVNLNGYKFNTAYNTNLTGGAGGLYFLGANAVAAYGGPVPLYTPNPWEAGSSVSHLDDSTFTGVKAQLMNAMADTGLGIRTLSNVELGILTDLGYTVKQNPTAASVLFVGLIFLRRRRNR
ncbi:MAG: Ig-like domain-containing protein [Mycobacterium sp.]